MTPHAVLLAAALAAPGPWYPPGRAPETPAARAERVELIASEIVDATAEPMPGWPWGAQELAWAVYVVTRHESRRWALEVHSGRLRGDRGRSGCLGGIMRGTAWAPRERWLDMLGTDRASTALCLRTTAAILAFHAGRCLGPREQPSEWAMARVFTGYGTGGACSPKGRPWASHRARDWARLVERSRAE